MQALRRIIVIAGVALVLLGAAAGLQDPEQDPLGLRLFPALALKLDQPFVGGGDFPASLSAAGIVAVYLVPGSLLMCLGLLFGRK